MAFEPQLKSLLKEVSLLLVEVVVELTVAGSGLRVVGVKEEHLSFLSFQALQLFL